MVNFKSLMIKQILFWEKFTTAKVMAKKRFKNNKMAWIRILRGVLDMNIQI